MFTLTPSQEAGGLIDTAQPLADALAERLGVEVTPQLPTDYAGVIIALDSGQAQIAGGLGPVQMVQAEDEAGADLILQSERFGSYEYVTQWFTNDPDTYCGDEPVADPETGFLFCNGVTADAPAIRRTDRRGAPRRRRRARRSPSSTRARRPATWCRRCSCSTPASTRSRTSIRCSPAVTTRPCRPCTTVTPRSACRSTTPARLWSSRCPTSASKSSCSPGRSRSPTTASPSPAICRTDLTGGDHRRVPRHRRDRAGDPRRRCTTSTGLTPVDSADYDVIRELRTELADLLE